MSDERVQEAFDRVRQARDGEEADQAYGELREVLDEVIAAHRADASDPMRTVAGFCPMGCGRTLFLGDGGHVTCSLDRCPNPSAADELLARAASASDRFMREEKQAIFSTAVGIARLRLRHGDLQGASDALDDACDEAHVKQFDACIQDGHPVEAVEQFLGPRDQKTERARVEP